MSDNIENQREETVQPTPQQQRRGRGNRGQPASERSQGTFRGKMNDRFDSDAIARAATAKNSTRFSLDFSRNNVDHRVWNSPFKVATNGMRDLVRSLAFNTMTIHHTNINIEMACMNALSDTLLIRWHSVLNKVDPVGYGIRSLLRLYVKLKPSLEQVLFCGIDLPESLYNAIMLVGAFDYQMAKRIPAPGYDGLKEIVAKTDFGKPDLIDDEAIVATYWNEFPSWLLKFMTRHAMCPLNYGVVYCFPVAGTDDADKLAKLLKNYGPVEIAIGSDATNYATAKFIDYMRGSGIVRFARMSLPDVSSAMKGISSALNERKFPVHPIDRGVFETTQGSRAQWAYYGSRIHPGIERCEGVIMSAIPSSSHELQIGAALFSYVFDTPPPHYSTAMAVCAETVVGRRVVIDQMTELK